MGRPLINYKNNKGTRIEPCGTPVFSLLLKFKRTPKERIAA